MKKKEAPRRASNGQPAVWTEQYVQQLLAQGKIKGYRVIGGGRDLPAAAEAEKPKKNKYKNTRTRYNGHNFQSAKECREYRKLLLRQKAGEIGQLRLQVPYELNAGGEFSYRYFADFVFIEVSDGLEKVIDAKGHRTAEYLKKKRLMREVHGIEIIEV